MRESNLSIVPIFKSLSWMRKFGYKKPVQNHRTKIGIKIKNIDKNPFNGGKIKKVIIHESGVPHECALAFTTDNEIKIPKLNSGEIKEIWFETILFRFSGLVWFKFELECKNKIISYQWDMGNKSHTKYEENYWSDIFLIKDESILQQQFTNGLLIGLTIAMLIGIGVQIYLAFIS